MPTIVTSTSSSSAIPPGGAAPTCVVKPGDTLSGIAARTLGDANRWREIYDLNRGVIPSPNALRVGVVLALPATARPDAPAPAPRPQPAQPGPTPVGPGPAPGGGVCAGTVCLTFDDGPNATNTPKILGTLKEKGVKATFFVTGEAAKKNPAILRQIVAEGHSLGNHTYDHANLSKLGRDEIIAQLRRTQEAVDAALGYHYPLEMVRPPYGASNATVRGALSADQHIVLWDVDSNDWRYPKDPDKILANVFSGADSVYKHNHGGRILMHDIHAHSAAILGTIVGRLLAERFEINRLDAPRVA